MQSLVGPRDWHDPPCRPVLDLAFSSWAPHQMDLAHPRAPAGGNRGLDDTGHKPLCPVSEVSDFAPAKYEASDLAGAKCEASDLGRSVVSEIWTFVSPVFAFFVTVTG